MILLVPVPPPNGGGGSRSGPPPPGSHAIFPAVPSPSSVPIKHIVILMQENHAFDNYFGTYCPKLGAYCATVANGTPPGTCEPLYVLYPSLGCDKPWRFPNASSMPRDILHDRNVSLTDFDNGTNLGFVPGEGAGNLTMGYYDWREIGDYWQLAQQYALGDDFFSSAMSYSLANHWYLLAGDAPTTGVDEYVATTKLYTVPWSVDQAYLNESNATPAIDDLLINSSVSWDYYDWALPSSYARAIQGTQVYSYWNPLAAKAESYSPSLSSHFLARDQFFADAANGTLPNVSWVIPSIPDSEHPPYNVTTGEQFAMNVTNAVESSPEWNSTALFITWDEFGGYYDSVPPPQVDGVGLSFRVPLLVVSPWTRANYVDPQFGDFESLLKLVEWRFGLASLTARDANATLPLDAFDFAATPRLPHLEGAAQGASYPVGFQSLGLPKPPTNVTVTPQGGALLLRWTPPVGGAPVTYYRLTYYLKGVPVPQVVRIDGAADGYFLGGLASSGTYYLTLASYAPSNLSSLVPLHARTLTTSAATPPLPGSLGYYGGGAVLASVTEPADARRRGRRPAP